MKQQHQVRLGLYTSQWTNRHATFGRRPLILITVLSVAVIVLLIIAATWKLTLGNRIIARGDLLLYFYPLRDYASEAIRTGYLPLWNPYTFMGAPFLANSQVGFFYPFNILMSWMPVWRAVSLSIVLHLCIAGLGAFVLARTQLKLNVPAAIASAITFSLGGYLGSQVEHLNQLQVLSWLPLELAIVGSIRPDLRCAITRLLTLSGIISIQVFAGHTQSLYISMISVGIVATSILAIAIISHYARHPAVSGTSPEPRVINQAMALVSVILVAILLAIGMSAIQLLPTAELAALSARSGGLPFNEVGSFSWRPWIIARAILPTLGDPLFPEYVAYIGETGIALSLLATIVTLVHLRKPIFSINPQEIQWRLITLLLIIIGFVLSLGIATPLFSVLYRLLPGFNLFRAQARWLVIFALGMSMLAGYGIQAICDGFAERYWRKWLSTWLIFCLVIFVGLLAGTRLSPESEYQALPATSIVNAWIIGSILTSGMIIATGVLHRRLPTGLIGVLVLALLTAESLIASQYLPYSRASDEQALTEQRPAPLSVISEMGQLNPASPASKRVLALSGLFFDPGDMTEQRLIYQDQLSSDELYDRIIASKQKEILSPNMSLLYRIPGVDGYDGGLLPLSRYVSYTQSIFSNTSGYSIKPRSSDGRLRESLKSVPDNKWLSQMAVRYIVTDKTSDVFINNIYYDLQFPQTISSEVSLPLMPFSSTALGLVVSTQQLFPDGLSLRVAIYQDSTMVKSEIVHALPNENKSYYDAKLVWGTLKSPTRVVISPSAEGINLLGMTSIDEPGHVFRSQQIHDAFLMQLVHSGDVKVYENLNAAPRISVIPLAECSTVGVELSSLSAAGLTNDADLVTVVQDSPELMVLDVVVNEPGYVVVRDAYYPGWSAKVDNDFVTISPIDTLFRAIPVMPGRHHIVISYAPLSVSLGAATSIVVIAIWLVVATITLAIIHKKQRWIN